MRSVLLSIACAVLAFLSLASRAVSQLNSVPRLPYTAAPRPFKLPAGFRLEEVPGVAIGANGHIFVFHRGTNPLLEFDADGNFVRTIGEGLFLRPHMVRIDADGNIWTVDIHTNLVLKLSPQGDVLLVLGRKQYAGDEDYAFNKPTDVAIGPSGDIYVTDGYGNSRVMKFDKNGKFLKRWGKKGTAIGEFDLPHAIVVDRNGLVYVGDRSNGRIQIFDSDGNFVRAWTNIGHPWGLCLAPDDSIYIADGHADRILRVDLNGSPLGVLEGSGKAPGQFAWPHSVAVSRNGDIYVSEILSWRVQKFVKR